MPTREPYDLTSFSLPGLPGAADALFDAIVAEHAVALVGQMLAEHGSDLDLHAPGTRELLTPEPQAAGAGERLWDPALGALLMRRSDPLRTPVHRAVALALHHVALGKSGRFEARLSAPMGARIGARLLPEFAQIEVDATAASVRVRLDGGSVREFERFSPGHRPRQDAQFARLPAAQVGRREVQVVDPRRGEALWPSLAMPADAPPLPDQEIAPRALHSAGAWLAACAPEYLPWVERTLRSVHPVDDAGNLMRSGSEFERPGLVLMSLPHTPVQVAEALVHECSHQHFHCLERVGAMIDPQETRLFHSPLKDRGRPLGMIAYGFHAFANVARFYRLCLQSEHTDEAARAYCRSNLDRHAPELELMWSHLEHSSSLTPLGNALLLPLALDYFEAPGDCQHEDVHASSREPQ